MTTLMNLSDNKLTGPNPSKGINRVPVMFVRDPHEEPTDELSRIVTGDFVQAYRINMVDYIVLQCKEDALCPKSQVASHRSTAVKTKSIASEMSSIRVA